MEYHGTITPQGWTPQSITQREDQLSGLFQQAEMNSAVDINSWEINSGVYSTKQRWTPSWIKTDWRSTQQFIRPSSWHINNVEINSAVNRLTETNSEVDNNNVEINSAVNRLSGDELRVDKNNMEINSVDYSTKLRGTPRWIKTAWRSTQRFILPSGDKLHIG